MKRLAFVFSIILIAFASCNRTDNYIIPVDYEKYYEGITSLTEKEDQELSQRISMDWYNNTMGKEIPELNVKDLDGKTVKIKNWLKRETILVFTDTHCGFGKEEVEKELPSTISNMKDDWKALTFFASLKMPRIQNPTNPLIMPRVFKAVTTIYSSSINRMPYG